MTSEIPMLKYMVLSALIGFFVFCASYSILVWKKRRQPAPGSAVPNRLRGWSITFVVLGLLGVAITFAMREAVRAEGILRGDGLDVVRSEQGMKVVYLAEEGPVKEGDILARFSSPDAQSEIDDAAFNRDILEKQKEVLAIQPLPLNLELVRKHEYMNTERRQLLSNLTHLLPSSDVAVRESTHQIIDQQEAIGKIDNELKVARGDLRQKSGTLEVAKVQLRREGELSRRNNLATNDLNERQKEVLSLQGDVAKYQANVASIEDRRIQAKKHLDRLEEVFAKQSTRFSDDLKTIRADLARVKDECDKIDQELYADNKIGQMRREGELAALDTRIKQAEHQLQAKRNKLERRASADGLIVFRHPSPGAALDHGPVIVFSQPDGLRFHTRLNDNQVAGLQSAGTIAIDLEETANTIEQRFPGKFLKALPLTREPGMSLVALECQAPPETVAALTEGKPIKARFSWRPPVMNMWPFPTSLVLIALGVLGLLLCGLRDWKPSWPSSTKPVPEEDDEESIVAYSRPAKEGDTVEARDTIPERPLLPHIPREVPIEPWEHPVGIRLREAIIREDISTELVAAVETAIEQKHDAVIVPLREALRRAPSVPDHARRLLDKLNRTDSNNEIKEMEMRCLAQRVTFLLYTIGIEIPSQPRGAADVMQMR
jgi:hypothetical protein